jgi:CDP-diacylglycerol--serine O-phosphatidyltransferase
MVWVGADNEIAMTWILAIAVCIIVCLAALLMVSNIKYYSFKGIDFKARVPFIVILALVLVMTLVHIDPPKVLLAIMSFYALSGPVMHVYRRGKSGS